MCHMLSLTRNVPIFFFFACVRDERCVITEEHFILVQGDDISGGCRAREGNETCL